MPVSVAPLTNISSCLSSVTPVCDFGELTTSGGNVTLVILGPVPSTAMELLQAITYGVTGEGKLAARSTYRAIKQNIPFLNLFYIKTGFDYLFGYTIQELLSPGSLKRVEKKLKKEYDQDFIFPKPSSYVNRF